MSRSCEVKASLPDDSVSPPDETSAQEKATSSSTVENVLSKNRPHAAAESSGSSSAARATRVKRPRDVVSGGARKQLSTSELQRQMTADKSSLSTATESLSTSTSKSEDPQQRAPTSVYPKGAVDSPQNIQDAHKPPKVKAIAGGEETAGSNRPGISSVGKPSEIKQPIKEGTFGASMLRPTTSTTSPLPAAKTQKPVSLITPEELRRAGSKARERQARVFSLEDMAECFSGYSWRELNHDTWRKRGFSLSPHNVRPDLIPLHQDNAQGSLRVVQDYEVLNRYSHFDYLLYPLAVFLLACIVVFVIFTLIPMKRAPRSLTEPLSSQVCSSADCLKNAEYLSGLLSWDDVNPCHDFYSFVCRQWMGSATPSPDGASISSDDDIAEYLEARLHNLLQDVSSRTQDHILPAATLHQKCMDTTRIEDGGWDPLLELMPAVLLEGFPFTPPVRSGLNIWKTAASLLCKTGTSALFGVGVSSDPKTPSEKIVSLKPPDSLTSIGVMDVHTARTLYTQAASTAMKSLKKEYVPSAYIDSIAEFASNLESLVDLALEEHWPMRMNFSSSSPVSAFFNQLFSELQRPIVVGRRLPVMVQSYPIVSRILKLAEHAEAHTVMNYLGTRLMIQLSPFLPTSELAHIYSALIYGRHTGLLPRWRLCVRATEKAVFHLAYASLLSDVNANVSTSKLADQAREVVAEFVKSIETNPYFTPESRLNMRTILKWTHLRVMGPHWASDRDSIKAYVHALPVISNDTGLETYVRLHHYTFDTSLAREPSQRWSHSALSTECWFEPYPDTIYIPMAVFNISHAIQGGADDLQLPRLATKVFGCVFAALLSKTSVEPPDGQQPWYSGKTKTALEEVEACVEPRKPSADTVGFGRTRDVLAAGFAYDLFLKKVRSSQRAVALRLTQGRSLNEEQLFFVYLMLQRCENSGFIENSTQTGGYNWNIALRNNKYFSNAFECVPGSAMNPTKKCVEL